jgi:N-acetylmuramoyl-L-alanine amidase
MWDSSRYRRLSQAPVERLIPLAANPPGRAEEVAGWLRDRFPKPAPLDPTKPLRIVLDIGHMPRNDSAPIKGQGMTSAHGQDEYELNRKAALAMASALRDSLGAEVIVHNEDGLQRQLRARTAFARQADADLFLSIHHDAVQLSQTSVWTWEGVERLYCDSISGFSLFVHDSSVNFPQALSLARSIGGSLRAGGRAPNLHHARPAERAGREVLDSTSGVYRADFAVLLSARMPAILVECGVALNRQEELILDSDPGRAEFARLVASGVKQWLAAGAPGAQVPVSSTAGR